MARFRKRHNRVRSTARANRRTCPCVLSDRALINGRFCPSVLSDSRICPSVLSDNIMVGNQVRGAVLSNSSCCFTTRRNDCAHISHFCPQHPKIFLTCGVGYEFDLNNVPEGPASLLLASIEVNRSGLRRPLVKIDFSSMIEVEDGNEVELTVALRRNCNGNCTTLETWEVEFEDDSSLSLPFSFTFCDDDVCPAGCCVYTVEIVRIEVEGGNFVNELEVENTHINAIVQDCL